MIYRSKLNAGQAVEKIRETLDHTPEILHLLDFIASSQRGIIRRPVRRHGGAGDEEE